ncbi:hypothetical protein [Lacihabitans lacunae]|uniref:Uncharacterized protein n=1 Tax=Lacihabitans lacunae TaxID=1028214 RepID=A0ABV7Z178_9BACT
MMKNLLGIVLILICILIYRSRYQKESILNQKVTNNLTKAVNASTKEIASEELTKTLTYLKSKKLTKGFTSIMWKTKNEDIGYWYENLEASKRKLQPQKSANRLENTLALKKLNEAIMDTGKKTRPIVPEGLAVYPNNKQWAFLMTIATLMAIIGTTILIHEADKKQSPTHSEIDLKK